MQFQRFRRHFGRRFRKSQAQVEDLGQQAERGIERYLFRRFERLGTVRRFVIGWILLIILLIGGVIIQNFALSGYFQTLRAVPGGIYSEGILGTFTTANPLFATSDVDSSVSHLVFAGLLNYNDSNQLSGDLATGYSVDAAGTTYTVHLKPHLTWQDGKPLTSRDVLFTYRLIQNPDVGSPLQNSWQGVTITAPDPTTIQFKLPGILASFPYNLTNGIVPQHLLQNMSFSSLRSADFNTVHPVGSGPFSWQAIQVSGNDPSNAQVQIALTPFKAYQGGEPKLHELVIYGYASQDQLVQAFRSGQLSAVEGLTSETAAIRHIPNVYAHNFLLTAGNYTFFKTTSGVLSDKQVRQALVEATNVNQIISNTGYSTRPVREPLLEGQLGYNPIYAQAGYNLQAAQNILNQDGWVLGKNGIRSKNGQPLTFILVATNSSEYQQVTRQLQQQWRQLGVKLQVELQSSTDFTTTLTNHGYDAVLYGISIGIDPDVFVYWDSSQADIRSTSRLNLSEYKSTVADDALEAGRTRLDPLLRTIKYRPFLQAWQQDAPALGLYQPRMLYLTNGPVAGLNEHLINNSTDRYDNVQNWEIRQAKVTNR